MTTIRKHSRLLLLAVSCAVIGAGASAIASAGASTSSTSASHSAAGGARHGIRGESLRRAARRAVQGNLVLATKQGFANVTFERGKVNSVSGQQLAITEGTVKRSYKTVTLTIPTTARVRDNRQPASLSSLKAGQRVIVIQAPKQTYVIARTPKTP